MTCEEHKKDPHWHGGCEKLNNGQPGWGGGKGLHLYAKVGWVQYNFAGTKLVSEVQIEQLKGYETKSLTIKVLQPRTTAQWVIIKVYKGNAKALTTYRVPNGGVAAAAVRIEMTGQPPKDPWVRMKQVRPTHQIVCATG